MNLLCSASIRNNVLQGGRSRPGPGEKDGSFSSSCLGLCLCWLDCSHSPRRVPQTVVLARLRGGERALESGPQTSLDGSTVKSKLCEMAFRTVPSVSREVMAFWSDENQNSCCWLVVVMKTFFFSLCRVTSCIPRVFPVLQGPRFPTTCCKQSLLMMMMEEESVNQMGRLPT